MRFLQPSSVRELVEINSIVVFLMELRYLFEIFRNSDLVINHFLEACNFMVRVFVTD